MAPTSTCRTSVGVAVLGGYLYAVGGQDGVSCLNIVERYRSEGHFTCSSTISPCYFTSGINDHIGKLIILAQKFKKIQEHLESKRKDPLLKLVPAMITLLINTLIM